MSEQLIKLRFWCKNICKCTRWIYQWIIM